ncbi:hypothetical protein [Limisphaera sp. 4302-co]|uniref:hypothetical protein n=1 Tax=Limisphaera sp. 4302-co TaxID=3400417 RepID=UPI003C177C66
MAFWRKKTDPWRERERALRERIRSLEEEIRQLEARLQVPRAASRTASAQPPLSRPGDSAAPESGSAPGGEPLERRPSTLSARADTPPTGPQPAAVPVESPSQTPHLYNEYGQRKYDLPGLWRSLRAKWSEPPPSGSSELVRLLAAGGAPELRPLRYERRIARNRFLALLAMLILVVFGIAYVLIRAP